jgi:hypothetical protein
VELQLLAENSGKRRYWRLKPGHPGMGRLRGWNRDRLLHSTAMARCFATHFTFSGEGLAAAKAEGMVVSRYPNGFHGSALQLMPTMPRGRGGLRIGQDTGAVTRT